MRKRILVGVATTFLIAACGTSHSSAPGRPAHPAQACLQLHNWQLLNHGQGVSKALQAELKREARGTQLAIDLTQWAQDLDAPLPSKGNVMKRITQLLEDARAVASDCESYGVRNTLTTG